METTAESPTDLDLLLSKVGCFTSCEAAIAIRDRVIGLSTEFAGIKSVRDLHPQTLELALQIREATDLFICAALAQADAAAVEVA